MSTKGKRKFPSCDYPAGYVTSLFMELIKYDEISGKSFADMISPLDVIIIPISAPENHGPHLPLGTDLYISNALAKKAGELFKEKHPETNIFIYPPIPIGGATIKGAGSVKFRSHLLGKGLTFLGKRLIKQGFRRIAFITAHGGVPHVNAIDRATETLNGKIRKLGKGGAISPTSRIMGNAFAGLYLDKWKEKDIKLPEKAPEYLLPDLHAGWMETSMMLAIRPDLVSPDFKNLPAIIPPDRPWLNKIEELVIWFFHKLNMEEGKRLEGLTGLGLGKLDLSWIIKGRAKGYCGRPALATGEFGQALIDSLGTDIADAFEKVFINSVPSSEYRSAAYWFRWLKLFGLSATLAAVLIIFLLSQ